MLRFDHLSLRRGSRLLLNDTTFFIHAGWRVGLTGRNGTGKSSLLALIGGELTPDGGDFSRPREWTLAHVRQETPALARSALDYALDGDAEFRRLEAELAAPRPPTTRWRRAACTSACRRSAAMRPRRAQPNC
ncbi:MAG: ATP-binding cassette domain-containing protein [Dokdonella sp.]|nr:ATP-binding cassette domain-containing protein [Dokdonella sp.]